MKIAIFLVIVVWLASGALSEEEEKPKCRLASLIPEGTLEVEADFDLEEAAKAPPKIDDPLAIKNSSISIDGDFLKGDYSIWNGIVTGLSTLEFDSDYDMAVKRVILNGTLEHVRITGIYEVIGGQVNLTNLDIPLNETGVHTFSGSGPLNASASNVVASASFRIKIAPYVSVQDLNLDLTFESADIVAENLVLDGETVNWELINALMKPTFDKIWGAHKDAVVRRIQDEINRLLEGCTLMDIINIIKPKP